MNQDKKMKPPMMREETLDDEYVITVKGKEVARHEKESDARSTWHKLRRKHGNDVKVKKEEIELDEVNVDAKGTVPSKQIASLKKAYNSLPDRIDPEKAMALAKMLDRFGEGELRQLTHAGIKFISTLAINKLIMKHKYKAKDIHDIRKNKPKTVFD